MRVSSSTKTCHMVICIYEDRASDLVGVKLLILSLARHCPDLSVQLFCPTATPNFCRWLEMYPQVRLRELPATNNRGWNVKPDILLMLLSEGYNQVVWIDSDIIITKDFRHLLAHTADDTFVAAQENRWEALNGSVARTEAWGLAVARELESTVCSCFLRVTPAHERLLEEWKRCLAVPAYLEAQKKWPRPVHMIGDQDVLTALLGSSAFADVKLHYLKRGTDIAQCFQADGYTVGERLTNIFSGLPVFVHSQGPKPWRDKGKEGIDRTYLELSPYCYAAQPYCQQLNEDSSWLNIESSLGKVLSTLALHHPSLQGLPLALQSQLRRVSVKTIVRQFASRFSSF